MLLIEQLLVETSKERDDINKPKESIISTNKISFKSMQLLHTFFDEYSVVLNATQSRGYL